jgi:hypothetical protein
MGNAIICPLNPDYSEFINTPGAHDPPLWRPDWDMVWTEISENSDDFQKTLSNEYLNGAGTGMR